MRARDLLERIHIVNLHNQLASRQKIEQLGGVLVPLLLGVNVANERWAQKFDVLGNKSEEVDRVDGAGLCNTISSDANAANAPNSTHRIPEGNNCTLPGNHI